MWEKFKANFEKHPYIFVGVAVAVILFIFWGSGSKASSQQSGISAEEATAIATSAQANAALQADTDQLQAQEAGFNAAVTINASNNSTAYSIAQLSSAVATFAIGQKTAQESIAAGAQSDHDNMVLASQNSAEDWLTHLETAKLAVPKNLVVTGLAEVSDATAQAAAKSTKPTLIQTILGSFNPGSNGMQGAGNSTNPSNSGGDGTVSNN